MVGALRKRVEGLGLQDRLTIVEEDVLKAHLPQFDVCVANIPYGISSPLIAKLLFGKIKLCFRSATLLLQKEFAWRLMAKPGDSEFNRLAVNVGLVATVKFLMNVSKKDFVPCPKVDSSLVRIQQRSELPEIDMNEWLAFTRTCFSKRNKTLGAIFRQKKKILELSRKTPACATNFGVSEDDHEIDERDDMKETIGLEYEDVEDGLEVGHFKEKIIGILKTKGFDNKRPSKMSHQELLDLLHLFNQHGVLFNC
ncbi:uncharacterized protein A4U43_C03F28090 [Asparagus officinalis]|uniref:rRNA adenine N(6)-methyltransferase n=2 Tax=Asparagus officinalis TaxID=4686 RepID=A0A5P1FGC6_ASPOF|nr:uncharacterized protein A4U43_C03F28090 [Asparagus officinalis]